VAISQSTSSSPEISHPVFDGARQLRVSSRGAGGLAEYRTYDRDETIAIGGAEAG
jgi:hypothetical protein